MAVAMHQLFDQIHKVPQVPEIVRQLINQLSDPNTDMLDIAKNVEKEQVIALKVLRLVNSAHFGLSRKIASIDEAVMLLGMGQLKTLVIASGIVSAVPSIDNFDLKQFWNEIFRTAEHAKSFAAAADLEADIAYTAGLLSGLGNILIHLGLPKEANEIDQHVKAGTQRRLDIEKNRLGFTGLDACAELCRRWKFANTLVATLAEAGTPLAAAAPSKLACALHLALHVAQCAPTGLNIDNVLKAFPYKVADAIGLDESTIAELLPDLLNQQTNLTGLVD